jgi:hypothetical protein
MSDTSPHLTENAEPKPVAQGLAGLDIDPEKMSAKTKKVYESYQQLVNDDSPYDDEKALKDAEHALRNAINADKLDRQVGELEAAAQPQPQPGECH